MLKIIEIGQYLAPAYAGMILAEQGIEVYKWAWGIDPILDLKDGEALWTWLNDPKIVRNRHATELFNLKHCDGIISNLHPSFFDKHQIDRDMTAKRLGVPWVHLCSETGDRSFDIIAQARSWMEYAPYVPFYIGDTSAGLWMAFKLLSMVTQKRSGLFEIGQASCMQKLVEGELVYQPVRDGVKVPWDEELYESKEDSVSVEYRGHRIDEPVRDTFWKLQNLWHNLGRIRI